MWWKKKQAIHDLFRFGWRLFAIMNSIQFIHAGWVIGGCSHANNIVCIYVCKFVCSYVWVGGLCKFKSKHLCIFTHFRCRDVIGSNCIAFLYKYDCNDKTVIFQEGLSNDETVQEVSRNWQPDLKCIFMRTIIMHILHSR